MNNTLEKFLVYLIVAIIVFIPFEVFMVYSCLILGYYNTPLYLGLIVCIINIAWVWYLKSYGIKKQKKQEITQIQLEKISYIGVLM